MNFNTKTINFNAQTINLQNNNFKFIVKTNKSQIFKKMNKNYFKCFFIDVMQLSMNIILLIILKLQLSAINAYTKAINIGFNNQTLAIQDL